MQYNFVVNYVPERPNCSSDLLLHLPFDDHFNDITCNKAIATRYGKGVSIVNDPEKGHVAFFNGHGYLEVSTTSSLDCVFFLVVL